MEKDNHLLNPNPIVQYLNKPSALFTKHDLVTYIRDNQIEMINFHYVAEDSRLKTLNFVINNSEHLDSLLTSGERVDGSSLFSHIKAGESDLYVLPRYRTAFKDPFAEIPTLSLLCSFFTKNGELLESSPEYILKKAHKALIDETGLRFEVMGELEYYVISEEDKLFPATNQRGYHESFPFNKMADFRTKAMQVIAQCGGNIKYGHSEVGNFVIDGKNYEQNEIEFLPSPLEEAADQLYVAKWVLRNLAYAYGVDLTFAPKISVGKAGSGLHIHTRLMKDGANAMVEDGKLSDIAKKAIAGYLTLALSLTAFGNTNPTSYFRLVPHQEAPTNICWGDRNRSTLVRVPLGWTGNNNMAKVINPLEDNCCKDYSNKQTVEFRCPDGSADLYMLLAGLTVAARIGLTMPNALDYASETYVDVNIFDEEHKEKLKRLKTLPASCFDSALLLDKQRDFYLAYNVFTPDIIDKWILKLKKFDDQKLREKIAGNNSLLLEIVNEHIHCG